MTTRQAWILAGVAGAVVAIGYLATKREISATISTGEATITYQTSVGAQAAPTAIEDSHARMLRLIEESEFKLKAYDVDDG